MSRPAMIACRRCGRPTLPLEEANFLCAPCVLLPALLREDHDPAFGRRGDCLGGFCWKCQRPGYGQDPNHADRRLCFYCYGQAVERQEETRARREMSDPRIGGEA